MTTFGIYEQFPVHISVGYFGKVEDGAQVDGCSEVDDPAWLMIALASMIVLGSMIQALNREGGLISGQSASLFRDLGCVLSPQPSRISV